MYKGHWKETTNLTLQDLNIILVCNQEKDRMPTFITSYLTK